MLSYINAEEAALLKARGGTGELHKGIPSYAPGSEKGLGGGSSKSGSSGGGSRGRGGGRSSAGMSTSRSPTGQFGGGGREDRPRQIDVVKAKAQTQAQIDAAKKAQEAAAKKAANQGLLANFLDYVNPGTRLDAIQNQAAQVMGAKFLDVLRSDEQAEVVRDTTGRVTGVRDKYGRLTGRDPAQERERQDRDGPEDRRKRLAAATQPPPTAPGDDAPTLGKRVIRSDLAIETEAERARGRRLGKRSLLSRVATLGA